MLRIVKLGKENSHGTEGTCPFRPGKMHVYGSL